ncbi:thioredoxin-like protein [Basidiobolus meristosporus CBS 931.73]|uniref:Thioredoxin-like protein n=1 Tax=Basidiobolus meristosporus CBS 931.73 TaxID=1314790 RepID=A0A1Y1YRL7_9FUNG|nr:thioredoxin-like protein [Basidiobolus meristosporus CBS 931.73]|eukprot:ORY00680.1 thioredoxin-like protein [Basidiobolus meristosporus CBS 931.73]
METSTTQTDIGQLLDQIERLVDGEQKEVSPKVLQGKLVGLYFSASWCPPCKAFSPVLTQFAEDNKEEFVVVHVNLDKTKEDMMDFIQGKNWLSVPFEDEKVKKALGTQLKVYTIPSLIIVNTTTKQIVTTWGRSAISKNRDHCLQEWKEGKHGCSWYHLLKFW